MYGINYQQSVYMLVCTVKHLYSEQSREPNIFFIMQRCSPKRAEICSLPAIHCNTY